MKKVGNHNFRFIEPLYRVRPIICLGAMFVFGWLLIYVGIFFLDFGGPRWAADIKIN